MNRHHSHGLHHLVRSCMLLLLSICIIFAPYRIAVAQESNSGIELTIEEATPIISDTSGFSIRLLVHNTNTAASSAGTISVSTDPHYTFISRTDMQGWADGTSMIPTPHELLSITVASIPAGQSISVSGTLHAHDDALEALNSWGPLPLSIDYHADDAEQSSHTHLASFVTRSQAGLSGQQTPSMGISVAMPMSTSAWVADSTTQKQLITSNSVKNQAASVLTLSDQERNELKQRDQLHTKYSQLITVADPSVLSVLGTPHFSAIMQPSSFDITSYARVNDEALYASAGITAEDWSAETALHTTRQALGDDAYETVQLAWQGSDSWTMDALNTARKQGYTTVIATHDFSLTDGSVAQTETYRVPTDSGDITVLAAQPTLSALAQQHATSDLATAEQSDAGRLSRLIAQSAFYQTEQPYEDRNLLICVDSTTAVDTVSTLMETLQDATWLHFADLNQLIDSAGETSDATLPESISEIDTPHDTTTTKQTLRDLTTSREAITRLETQILQQDALPDALDNTVNQATWVRQLLTAHDRFTLAAMSSYTDIRGEMRDAAQSFSQALYDQITLIPSGSVTVVSESASMPVTVSNGLPFPIAVHISSLTDSMEIVTSRFTDITVQAHAEAQASISIRVSTAGTTIAHEQLTDRANTPFGQAAQTSITSVLQISDKSGVILIAFAVLLGLVGLYRQFHRKKDPDE